ncbi:hypothetical protein [Dactylosporangium sp. CA-139066]|uniref:hypothetical protein n=1 Tax=Dactylosporangium sp. CA-139066 TaxID=3239930 RepID=UPI003D90A074
MTAYDVNPISDPGVMAQPGPAMPFQNGQWPPPPNPGQQFPSGAYPQQAPPAAYPQQAPPAAYPQQFPTGGYQQVPTGGYPQLPPVSGGAPYPGMPVSPQPISVTPISGSPQPGYYQPLKPARTRALLPLTVIVVVLVIASTVIAVVRLRGTSGTAGPGPTNVATTQGGGAGPANTTPAAVQTTPAAATTTPAGDPKAQAAAVDALLDASISSRTKLNAAIDLVNKCTLIEKAISDMQTVGTERQSQIDSVARFDLSAIPEGEQVRSMLKEALGFSLAADRSFVPWGQAEQASGCNGGGQSYYDEAQRQSQNASDAKARFLGVWNPVAARYGLRSRSSNDI